MISMTATEASGQRNPNRAGTPSPFNGWGGRIGLDWMLEEIDRELGLEGNDHQARIEAIRELKGGKRLNGRTRMVEEVMAYLNVQARRNYRVKSPNGTPTAGALEIAKRLKEGYTVEQCKDIIGIKSNAWMGDEKMDQYLNPMTLFRKCNFDKYLAEAEAA